MDKTKNRGATISLLDPAILLPAIGQSFKKLDPRTLIRSPIMFVVEVVSVLTTIFFLRDLVTGGSDVVGAHAWFSGQIAAWLWFTVLFANFAEAVAEGRGKAQAATLRKARTETMAKRLTDSGSREYKSVAALSLKQGRLALAIEKGRVVRVDRN